MGAPRREEITARDWENVSVEVVENGGCKPAIQVHTQKHNLATSNVRKGRDVQQAICMTNEERNISYPAQMRTAWGMRIWEDSGPFLGRSTGAPHLRFPWHNSSRVAETAECPCDHHGGGSLLLWNRLPSQRPCLLPNRSPTVPWSCNI